MLNFKRVSMLYACLMMVFFIVLCVNNKKIDYEAINQTKKDIQTSISQADKTTITQHLVDQIRDNNKAYDNNVWTTLATIILAIGMLLGSDKFSRIVSDNENSINTIHGITLFLFGLHLMAYYSYQKNGIELLSKMSVVVSQMSYYEGYKISNIRLSLNSMFDFFLFILLSYIVDSFRKLK